MKDKQYALIVVCKQFLDADDYELQREDSEEWIVYDEYGDATTHSVLHSVPEGVATFSSLEEIEEFKQEWVPHPWWIVPKEWKVVEVEPVYTTMIVGWKKTKPVAASEQP